MKVMAAFCGIMIVVLGFWSTGHKPTEVQSAVEIVCLIGGLILCFMAAVLARLDLIAARLDALQPAPPADAPADVRDQTIPVTGEEHRPEKAVP